MQQLLRDCPGIEPSLQRLPQNVRMVLAYTPKGTTLSTLAEMADKVMEVAIPSDSVTTLKTHSSDNPPTVPASLGPVPATAAICAQRSHDWRRWLGILLKLVRQLVQLARPTPTPTLTSDMPNNALCWYHQKFGDQARGCRSPCSWVSNEQASH